jgi:hypothetical protein
MDSSSSSACHSEKPHRSPESSASDLEFGMAATFIHPALELDKGPDFRTRQAAPEPPIQIHKICCIGAGYVGMSITQRMA